MARSGLACRLQLQGAETTVASLIARVGHISGDPVGERGSNDTLFAQKE
jgi:hypothetical protein